MEKISNISFQNPEFLLLLLVIPMITAWHIWRKPDKDISMSMPDLGSIGGTHWMNYLQYLLPLLRAISFILLVCALARPQQSLKEEEITAEGIDIMIAMDISTSMLAEDFRPNRIEVSKALAQEFVLKRPYDRIGLVVFAGEAYTQSPLTTDHQIVNTLMSQLQCGILKDGTAIGMGLSSAVNRLKDTESKSRIIVLLTDGVNNEGYIDPYQASNIAKELGIKVYTIGIGSNGYAGSGQRGGIFSNRKSRVELDEKLLQHIATETKGKYYRAQTAQDLQTVYNEIDQLEKTKIEVNVMRRYTEEYRWLLALALSLLAIEFLLRHTLLRSVV
jgi:Ca-activated chloride channel homolog